MAEAPLLPSYLITGTDLPKVRLAVRRLRARFPDESVELLVADTTSGEEAVGFLNSFGLFGAEAGRLVLVEGAERWKAEDVAAVVAYLADPAPATVLALVTDEPPRTDGLAEACGRAGKVLKYDAPRPRDLPGWVRAQFEAAQVAGDNDAAPALVAIVGDDLATLAGEVDKLAAWAGSEPLTRRDVEALAVPAHEAAAWAVTDAWGGRDLPAALAACELTLEHKEPFSVAMSLAGHVGRVRAAQALAAQGAGSRDVAKKLRMKEYPARKALAHAQNYSRDELDAALVRLAGLDAALKGASRLAAELELERALIDLTRSPEPAGRR